MRVTQSMLATNSLQQIHNGYNRLGQLRDQLQTGKKITRPSQDPVVAMKGMRYRTQVTEVMQFQRNLSEAYNWMETADAALDQGTQALIRIRELATDAANDSKTITERSSIAKEIAQLREHLQSIANTKNSNKYIFNGTDTTNAPVPSMEKVNRELDYLFSNGENVTSVELVYSGMIFTHDADLSADDQLVFRDMSRESDVLLTVSKVDDELVVTYSGPNPHSEEKEMTEIQLRQNDVIVADQDAVSTNIQTVEIELFKGVTIPVNINPQNVFDNALFGDLMRLENALNDPAVDGKELSQYIDNVYEHIDRFVSERAELGARINRAEMMENRLMDQEITAKKIMSENEDADIEEVIINLVIQESIHRAALATGARLVQPSLIDFLR